MVSTPVLTSSESTKEQLQVAKPPARDLNAGWGLLWIIGITAGWFSFFLVVQIIADHLLGRNGLVK